MIGLLSFVLGLCVGSFINMAVYRLAIKYKLTKNKVFNKNRSFCDFCGRQLRWFENIPLLSWLAQRGRSRCCRQRLSFSYPLVELGLGILFWLIGFDPVALIVASLLIFSLVFDAKYMILPDFSTYVLIILAVFIGGHWLVAIGGGGFLLALNLITRGRGMGMGDVKLAVFMGMLLGYPKIVVAFYTAFIVGAVFGIGGIMARKFGRKSEIPFGPFLILGTVIAWYYGDKIWELSGLLP